MKLALLLIAGAAAVQNRPGYFDSQYSEMNGKRDNYHFDSRMQAYCVQNDVYATYDELKVKAIMSYGPYYSAGTAVHNAFDETWYSGDSWKYDEIPDSPTMHGLCMGSRTYCSGLKAWAQYPGYTTDLSRRPIWVTVDLGKVQTVAEIMVDHWGALGDKGSEQRGWKYNRNAPWWRRWSYVDDKGTTQWNHAPSKVLVWGSDDDECTSNGCAKEFLIKAFNIKSGKNSCEPQYYGFEPTLARFIRVEIVGKWDRHSPYVVIDEIKFYGPGNGIYNGDGITNHADDFYNQLTRAPTPAPGKWGDVYKGSKTCTRIPVDGKYCTYYNGLKFWDHFWIKTSDMQKHVKKFSNGMTIGFQKRTGGKIIKTTLKGFQSRGNDQTQCERMRQCRNRQPAVCEKLFGKCKMETYTRRYRWRGRTYSYNYQTGNCKSANQKPVSFLWSNNFWRDANTAFGGVGIGDYLLLGDCFTGGKIAKRGSLNKLSEQKKLYSQPTTRPTSYPTKSSSKACAYKNGFVHVGWKGAGEGKDYCNFWECKTRGTRKSAGGGFDLVYSSSNFPTRAKGRCDRHGCGMSANDFNRKVIASPNRIVKRECLDCHGDYQNVYYRRTGDNNVNYYALFHTLWASRNNRLNKDFELFSTYKDALKRTNKWNFCNYDDRRWQIGFPRDCGPNGGRGWQWNSRKHGGTRRRYAYFVQKKATGAYWAKTNRACKLVAKRNEKTCSDTKCKFDWSVPTQEILHYTFDNAAARFKNKLFNPNEPTSMYIYTRSVNRPWGWAWWSWMKHYYFIDINIVGRCRLTRWKGNMAWHVVNNAAHPLTSATRTNGCELNSKQAVKIPGRFDACQFTMLVRDVDVNFQRKESDDFMCFSVTDAKGNAVARSQKCQVDDINRRLEEEWYLGTRTWDRTVGYFYREGTTTLKTNFIPRTAMKGGFRFKIWAQSNNAHEHWYADDLKVNCRGKKVVKVRSHHAEAAGGSHRCGYSKFSKACACVCAGKRRQDARGFARTLNEIGSTLFSAYNKKHEKGKDFRDRKAYQGIDYANSIKGTKYENTGVKFNEGRKHMHFTKTPAPTPAPTLAPTPAPTDYPTPYPTAYPTAFPTAFPTTFPTAFPTAKPTAFPTAAGTPKCITNKSTPNRAQQYYHKTKIGDMKAVTFSVKARNDAHFGFLTDGRDYYEIALSGWGNRHTKIRRGHIGDNLRAGRKWDKAGRNTHGYLHGGQSRPFWASAKNGLVKIGKGSTLDKDTFLSWQDNRPLNVKYFAVMTGWGASGTWTVCNVMRPKCTGDHRIVGQFSYFNSGSATGCEHRHHYLYDYRGSDCIWTSDKHKIVHPHGYKSMFARFQMAEYGNLEDNDHLTIRLKTCKAANSNACTGWSQTVRMQDDVMGWRWTTVTGSRNHANFNGRSDWRNSPVGIGADDAYVQIQVQLSSNSQYSERHIMDNLSIYGACL